MVNVESITTKNYNQVGKTIKILHDEILCPSNRFIILENNNYIEGQIEFAVDDENKTSTTTDNQFKVAFDITDKRETMSTSIDKSKTPTTTKIDDKLLTKLVHNKCNLTSIFSCDGGYNVKIYKKKIQLIPFELIQNYKLSGFVTSKKKLMYLFKKLSTTSVFCVAITVVC